MTADSRTQSPIGTDTDSLSGRERIEADYETRLNKIETEISGLRANASLLSAGRGLLLIATFLLLGVGWFQWGAMWWVPGALVGLLFVTVAAIQDNAERQLRNARTRREMVRQSLAGMRREWERLVKPVIAKLPDRESVASDLDLVGPASLYQLLCTARTPFGMRTLRDWLLKTPARSEVVARQDAVKSLASLSKWREAVQLHAEQLASSKSGPEAVIEWAEGEPWYGRRAYLLWTARILSAVWIVVFLLLLVGGIDKLIGGTTLLVICAINFGLTVIFAGSIHMLFNQVSSRQNDVSHYRRLFRLLDQMPADTKLLKDIHQDGSYGGKDAFQQIAALGKIMGLANLRRSGFFYPAYLIFQFTLLWDFHALDVLERWQRRCGPHVRRWFEALGRAEALSCLAKLAHDEPDWCFPDVIEFQPSDAALVGTELGHPLIANTVRVCNDVQVGPAGSLLLVTGSNMSGKSTLLRALGVNISLAQAGTVVCAKSLKMPVVRLETSMRISDSLRDGVSFFMAELKRLKEVVDLAKETRDQSDHGFFYLLDEILQGTNSRERHIAVQEVIRHLLEMGAIGAVSTHDLELASAPGLEANCRPIHFRETIELEGAKRRMTFDYVLREGVATTSNALKLLALVGLHDEDQLTIGNEESAASSE